MSLIDALPGIDKDNEDPILREKVLQLIEEEMNRNDLEQDDHLLVKKALLSDQELNSLMQKIDQRANDITLPKILNSTDRMTEISSKPTQNLQEWEEKINQMKILYSHSENQLMNLELIESRASKPYLVFNSALESSHAFYTTQTKDCSRKIYEVQKQRRELQERLLPQLNKLLKRKHDSLGRKLACDHAIIQLKAFLQSKGFDYEDHLKEKELSEEKSANPHDQRFNSTVREYETVNEVVVEDVEDSDDDEEKEKKAKKARKH